MIRYTLPILCALLGACKPAAAPVDNAASTGCVPGTPVDQASPLCNDTTLQNGAEVVAPDNFSETEDRLNMANAAVNAD